MRLIRVRIPRRWFSIILSGGLSALPAVSFARQEILSFAPDDTLEEIRFKIEHNGYDFTVAHNRVFDMSPEEKARFFSRRFPDRPAPKAVSFDIGPLAGRLGKQLPASFDWRSYSGHSYIGDIRDQSACGSCYAFGACAAAEGTYNYARGLYDGACADFSESYIIWCLGRLPQYNPHFFGCGGADWDYAELTALTVEGVGNESDFPYTISDPGSCTHWGDQTMAFQSWHRTPCNDIDAIKTAIITYGVVDAAVYAQGAFQGYSGGVYEDSYTTCPPDPGIGPECYHAYTNHAISLVGWDDTTEPANGYWILRNSWGSAWGESGYMRIKYTSARVACEVCYLVYEPPDTPTPTPEAYHTATPTPTTTPTPEGYKTPTPPPSPSATPTVVPQAIPFTEDFEGPWSGGAPESWSREYVSGSINWTQSAGGYNGNPPAAHGGSYNALFFYDDYTGPVTRLITPRLDFSSQTGNSRLTFWHAMEEWSGDQDELAIYYKTSAGGSWNLLTSYNLSVAAWTERTINLPSPGNDYYICFEGTANYGYGVCVDDVLVAGETYISPTPTPEGYKTPTPLASATPTATPVMPSPPVATPTPISPSPSPAGGPASPWIHDFNGDGTSDIAIFRESSGLWSVRGVTRLYFGSAGDDPAPGDYNGDGTTEVGIFRASSGLWAIRNITRLYFGTSSDITLPGDYDGDGCWEPGIFRPVTGLWAVRGLTRVYFGAFADTPVPGYYDGDGTESFGVFRGTSGLWALKDASRFYFGVYPDETVPGDYDGDGTWEAGIYRPGTALWAIRDLTRFYLGAYLDWTVPADYDGDGTDDIGIFRGSSGLWAIRNLTRVYFGAGGDFPVTR